MANNRAKKRGAMLIRHNSPLGKGIRNNSDAHLGVSKHYYCYNGNTIELKSQIKGGQNDTD